MSNSSITAASIKQEEESSNTQFEVNLNGCMTGCNFYILDATTDDKTALAFRSAYHFAKNSKNNKELTACVASMLCSVVPGFKNSVEKALNATGIKPCFVSLPSKAKENNIVASEISQLDCPSILVIFGYLVILLLKPPPSYDSYGYDDDYHNSYIPRCIRNLKFYVRCDPSNKLDIPFDSTKAYAISTMLRTPELYETVKKFLQNSCNHPNFQIRGLCSYSRTLI